MLASGPFAGPLARPAAAATFTVAPTQVLLLPTSRSAMITVRNDSDEPLRFQVSVFTWTQGPAGDMQLKPTKDVVVFPALMSIEPHAERRVRLATVVPFEASEKTYRIFVEELPPPPSAARAQPAIRVLTRMGIPIFMRPAKPLAAGSLTGLAVRDTRLQFTVTNTGSVHVVPQDITVRGSNAQGHVVFDHPVEAWYILAGGRRDFDVALPPAACDGLTTVTVTVDFHGIALRERLDTPAGACARLANGAVR